MEKFKHQIEILEKLKADFEDRFASLKEGLESSFPEWERYQELESVIWSVDAQIKKIKLEMSKSQ